jgi:hypothetical protein
MDFTKLIGNVWILFCIVALLGESGCSWKDWRTSETAANWTYVGATILRETPRIAHFFARENKWAKLQIGDSMFKVQELLGNPDEVAAKDDSHTEWIYECKNKGRRTIGFENGFVCFVKVEGIGS